MIWLLIALACSSPDLTQCVPIFPHNEKPYFSSRAACVDFANTALLEGMNYRCESGRQL